MTEITTHVTELGVDLRDYARDATRMVRTELLRAGTRGRDAARANVRKTLGARVATAVRREVRNTPDGLEVEVVSQARGRGPGGPIDLVRIHAEGVTITSRSGRMLAYPAPDGPIANARSEGRKLTPDDFPRGFFAYLGDGQGGVLAHDGVAYFIVARRVQLRPAGIDPAGAAERAVGDLDARVARQLDQRIARKLATLARAA